MVTNAESAASERVESCLRAGVAAQRKDRVSGREQWGRVSSAKVHSPLGTSPGAPPLTFLLGYIAFAYVACQFANEARRRCEDELKVNRALALRAMRDFCAAYGLLIAISGLLMLLMVAGLPSLPRSIRLPLPDIVEGRHSWGLWLVTFGIIGLTVLFVGIHYVVEFSELRGERCRPAVVCAAVCAAVCSLCGITPRLARHRSRLSSNVRHPPASRADAGLGNGAPSSTEVVGPQAQKPPVVHGDFQHGTDADHHGA